MARRETTTAATPRPALNRCRTTAVSAPVASPPDSSVSRWLPVGPKPVGYSAQSAVPMHTSDMRWASRGARNGLSSRPSPGQLGLWHLRGRQLCAGRGSAFRNRRWRRLANPRSRQCQPPPQSALLRERASSPSARDGAAAASNWLLGRQGMAVTPPPWVASLFFRAPLFFRVPPWERCWLERRHWAAQLLWAQFCLAQLSPPRVGACPEPSARRLLVERESRLFRN